MSRNKDKRIPSKISLLFTMSYILTICGHIYAQQLTLEDFKLTPSDELARTFSKKGSPSGMWFGPRLGKRSHHGSFGANLGLPLQRLLLEAMVDSKKFDDLPELRPSSANTKRRFTPRLGRESGEEIQAARNIDFIPRLGRELDPHLVAQILASEDFPCSDSALFGRSVPEAVLDTKMPPFAPRLGRENMASFYVSLAVTSPPPCCGGNPPAFSEFGAPPFIPRLGRDSQNYDSSLDFNTLKDGGLRVARSASLSKHQENNQNN